MYLFQIYLVAMYNVGIKKKKNMGSFYKMNPYFYGLQRFVDNQFN